MGETKVDQQENLAPSQEQSAPVINVQPSEQAKLPAKMPIPTGGAIRALIPQSTEDIWRIAGMAVKSGMCPKGSSPESASISIMHGLEIGLPPMMALQRIAVINGRPCVWGDAVPAVAMNTGQLMEWNEFLHGEGDAMEAVCQVARRTANGIFRKEGKFSVDDAKKAGLWGKAGPWQAYPKRMLAMRARVAFRDLFADAMCGMYIAEEMIGSIPAIEATPSFERVERPLADDDEFAAGNGRTAANGAAGAAQQKSLAASPPGPGITGYVDTTDRMLAAHRDVAKEQQAVASNGDEKSDTAQNAPAEPAGEQKASPMSDSAKGTKASPEPPSERGEASQAKPDVPWVRRTGADYVEWARTWMAAAKSSGEISDRYTAERSIRNNLGTPLDELELAELMRIKEAAIEQCRKEA